MFGLIKNKATWLSLAIIVLIGSMSIVGYANQAVYSRPTTNPTPPPLLQPITVQTTSTSPNTTPTPLIKKTGSVTPVTPDIVNPANMEMTIPGYSGVLVETLDGKVVKESYSNYAFNPASNVKIATSFAVLKTFGPDYRFPTNIFTDGEIDPTKIGRASCRERV